MKRKTDNTPVTDENLARMRDEIAEAYSHASHETDSLIAAIDAGDMANVIAREKEIDALRSQLDEAVALLREVARRTPGYDSHAARSLRFAACQSDARSFLSRHDGGKVQS